MAHEQDAFVADGGWFIDSFRKQIEIYRAYWRDDPRFDDANRAAAAPLDCPEMDAAMLSRLARFAIQGNFGRARSRKVRSDFDLHQHVHRLLHHREQLAANVVGNHCLGLDVRGPGGGQWKLLLSNGRLTDAENGLSQQCSAVFKLDAPTFLALGARKLAADEGPAIGNGWWSRETAWRRPNWPRSSKPPRPTAPRGPLCSRHTPCAVGPNSGLRQETRGFLLRCKRHTECACYLCKRHTERACHHELVPAADRYRGVFFLGRPPGLSL